MLRQLTLVANRGVRKSCWKFETVIDRAMRTQQMLVTHAQLQLQLRTTNLPVDCGQCLGECAGWEVSMTEQGRSNRRLFPVSSCGCAVTLFSTELVGLAATMDSAMRVAWAAVQEEFDAFAMLGAECFRYQPKASLTRLQQLLLRSGIGFMWMTIENARSPRFPLRVLRRA